MSVQKRLGWIAGLVIAGAGLAVLLSWPQASKVFSMPASRISSQGARNASLIGRGSLLDEVASKTRGSPEADLSGPAPTTRQLEEQLRLINETQQQINELKLRWAAAIQAKKGQLVNAIADQGKQSVSLLNLRLSALQADLEAARRARPEDSTVQWLTGELLLIVGGEPDEIRPYFERALAAGLKQPQLFASLAKVEFDSNHFQAAYDYAQKALQGDRHSQSVWETYARASFGIERFSEVVRGLDRAFPEMKPPWAVEMRSTAQHLLGDWLRELALRQKEDKRGNLPMVRFTIEHRGFVNGAANQMQDNNHSAGERSTGRGVVEIELFEDQAPLAVANFLNLVEHGFYDGTSFHWAEAGRMVVGGDPNTKSENRARDGKGGPCYSIPDESNSALARGHFRGSISMVQRGPTAGSQFLITLVPCPEFNGHFTVFGRVIAGQEVIDDVTPGRTNREVGEFGKIIPGDLLVHAEVTRKRYHKYEVTRVAP
jgi:cyclophilin family peptidyl-prolyl cis-trans isomerase